MAALALPAVLAAGAQLGPGLLVLARTVIDRLRHHPSPARSAGSPFVTCADCESSIDPTHPYCHSCGTGQRQQTDPAGEEPPDQGHRGLDPPLPAGRGGRPAQPGPGGPTAGGRRPPDPGDPCAAAGGQGFSPASTRVRRVRPSENDKRGRPLRLATEPQSIRVDSRSRRPLRSTAAKVAIALALTAALSAGALIAAGVAPAGAGSAAEADLQIANTNVIGASTDCADVAPYVDTQTVPPLTINNIEPGTAVTRYVCVHNRGEAPAAVDLAIVNAAEVETGCTGDEADFDPDGAGCGTRGELGADLAVTVGATDVGPAGSCQGTPAAEVVYHGVADTAGEAITPSVGAGEYGCYRIDVVYLAFTPADQVQANQTDRTTWQFRFVGSATAAPDVSLTKSLADQTVDRAVWKLRVHNAGPGPVAGPITVVDHLPVGLAFVSGTGAGFSCDAVDRTVACTRADPIDAGDSAVITLVTAIDPGLAGTVTNRAEVLAAGDVNVGDNTGTARLVAGNGPGGGNGGGGGTGGQGGGGSEPLAFTGIDAGRLVILAAGLLAFGLALVWVARRGRRDQ